eukprot:3936505-Amphidinium_carterae.1
MHERRDYLIRGGSFRMQYSYSDDESASAAKKEEAAGSCSFSKSVLHRKLPEEPAGGDVRLHSSCCAAGDVEWQQAAAPCSHSCQCVIVCV